MTGVLPLLVVLFVLVPIVELAVIIQVGQAIGVVETLLLMVVVSVAGAWLVKREGIGVWRRAQRQMDAGVMPGRELVDGVLIMVAGALLLLPGFVSDCLGILLLLPPVRAVVRGRHTGMPQTRGQVEVEHPEIAVGHKKHYTVWEYTSQRYLYARSFAGARVRDRSLPARALYAAAAAVLLPPVLLARIVGRVWSRPPYRPMLLRSLPLLPVFVAAWAAGEVVGASFGPGDALSRVC